MCRAEIRGASLFLSLIAFGCRGSTDAAPPPQDAAADSCTLHIHPSPNAEATVKAALSLARAGDVLCFDEGTYLFSDSLSVATPGLTLRGDGRAVLDFRAQEGGERPGIVATASDVTIERIVVANTAGDALRAVDAAHVTFRHVGVQWEHPVAGSASYAIHALRCDGVVIEGCDVSGATDAAICIGQSKNIVVRDNDVHANVAGIEIENSRDSEVYGNRTIDNTAGILIFNLPHLPLEGGRHANVHDNIIERNNRLNDASSDALVSKLPRGIGLLVMAAADTDIHDNLFRSNDSAAIAIASCFAAPLGDCTSASPDYDPYARTTSIHGNRFMSNATEVHWDNEGMNHEGAKTRRPDK
jgi:parallel beta-helix repeat protein